jgi:hypothetical protein
MSELWCRRGFAPGLLLMASALSWPGSGIEAQSQTDTTLEAVREELDSLVPLMRTLGERAKTAEYRERMKRLAEEQRPVDTFAVGPFRVVALPDQRDLAEETIRATWDELRPLVDGSEDLLESWTFFIHYYWSREGMFLSGDTLLRQVAMSRRYPRSYLLRSAIQTVGNTVMMGLPPEIGAWSGGQPRISPSRLPWVARELIATPSTAVRRCFRGDLNWCVEALGLNGTAGGWERWYTAEERRHYIRGSTHPYGDRETAIWEGCVQAGMDDACDVFLADREPVIPLSPEARASLLGLALWTGGSGAFQRLRAANGEPLLDRLVAAAEVPRDSLLAAWRSAVLAARPSAWAGLVRSPLSLFFWLVLLGALALRSTRWRLG